MATIINKAAGTIAEKYRNTVAGISSRVTTGPVQKLWRARILTNRLVSGLEKVQETPIIQNPILEKVGMKPGPSTKVTKAIRDSQITTAKLVDNGVEMTKQYPMGTRSSDIKHATVTPVINWLDNKDAWEALSINNESFIPNKVIIYNTNVSPYQYIELQNRPTQVDFRGETTWAVIKSMGRNLPMYHYTSAEDIIQMNISWYCNDPDNPAEVLTKCRLLESWSKANGYGYAPPVLQIEWGKGDIFQGHYYILTSATYSLLNFQSGARVFNPDGPGQSYVEKGLFPSSATQELVFKRVSTYNPTWADMVSKDNLKITKGITV